MYVKTLLHDGKTKTVYDLGNGSILLNFKDAVTGHADGTEDPGGNQVVGEQAGIATATIAMSAYYFRLLEETYCVPTHFISADAAQGEMIVRKAILIGGDGLEFIKRYRATGSFMKRFGRLFDEGDEIDIIEITLKDDDRGDPVIDIDILEAAGITDWKELELVLDLFGEACAVIEEDLAFRGLTLWDIKLEIGLVCDVYGNYEWAIIDEIGPGNMRVYDGDRKLGKLELAQRVLGE